METQGAPHRSGMVAIIGRPNVGKSTLLNVLLDYKLAIVSTKPQTTRHQLLGVITGEEYQIAFLDTPGFLTRTGDTLDRRMLARARGALDDADLAVLVVEPRPPGEIERELMEVLAARRLPAVLAINKVDRVRKGALLPLMETYNGLHRLPGDCARQRAAQGRDRWPAAAHRRASSGGPAAL